MVGRTRTAQNSVFWLNMMRAVPQHDSGFPANVTCIRAASPATLTMTMGKAYSPAWFLCNDLSQVIPMPAAWDRTAHGPSYCTTAVHDCAAGAQAESVYLTRGSSTAQAISASSDPATVATPMTTVKPSSTG